MIATDRRRLIAGLAAVPALSLFGRAGAAALGDVFAFGVASGEPSSDGMVLWTRLTPQPMQPDGGLPRRRVPVRWEVYADEQGRARVAGGDAIADPDWGHSVHVEVRGLRPDRPYWYRFVADGVGSPIARTRTTPAPGAMTDRLRFCFASCQKYETGHYGAWAHAVADQPDLILFLGDYIYEAAPATGPAVRVHPTGEAVDLASYRLRYATYRLDPLLQAAHAVAPWAVTWDDHEVANDYAGLIDQFNGDPAAFARRRAAAYQTYYEFMPLRPRARPRGPAMQLYRTLDWGALAQFQILDDRQYRSSRPCQPPAALARGAKAVAVVAGCPDLSDPRRTLLGWTQERWLHRALGDSRAQWNVLAQQTQLMPYPRRRPEGELGGADPARRYVTADTWDGYAATRDRIVARWQRAGTRNPLVIGGDIHAFTAGQITDHDRVIAPALVGGSISSLAGDKALQADTSDNAAYRFARNDVRGYACTDLTPTSAVTTFRALRDGTDPRTAAYDLARFTVEAGRPELHAG